MGAARGSKQPFSCGCSSKWSLDPVKVCRALLFTRGTRKEWSKGCCHSRHGLNKHRAREKSPVVSAAWGIGTVPGAGCAFAERGSGALGHPGV